MSQDLDDHFEILINSNHDHRGGYIFEINPLGTQSDGLVEEQSASGETDFGPGWDGVWASEARITQDGWTTATIEMRFTTLNFTKPMDVTWGLDLKRFIRRKNEEDMWAVIKSLPLPMSVMPVSSPASETFVNLIKPYGLLQYDQQTGQNPSFPLTGGVDIKYGIRSNMVLNLTGNRDFSAADVNQEQFNLTPFPIFIPENANFFWKIRVSLTSTWEARTCCSSAARSASIRSRATRYRSTVVPSSPALWADCSTPVPCPDNRVYFRYVSCLPP